MTLTTTRSTNRALQAAAAILAGRSCNFADVATACVETLAIDWPSDDLGNVRTVGVPDCLGGRQARWLRLQIFHPIRAQTSMHKFCLTGGSGSVAREVILTDFPRQQANLIFLPHQGARFLLSATSFGGRRPCVRYLHEVPSRNEMR